MSHFRIRDAVPEDAAVLLAIYAPYVRDTAISFEYQVPELEEFRGRIAAVTAFYPWLVLEENGEPIGYAYAGRYKQRAAYDHSAELSVYLRQDCRGRGLALRLYAALEEALRLQNVCNAYACIASARPENDHLTNASTRFHERAGYRLCGTFTRCAFKFDQWYDMVWMEKFLGIHQVPQAGLVSWAAVRSRMPQELLEFS